MKDSKKEKILRSFIIERDGEKREYRKNLSFLNGYTLVSDLRFVVRSKGRIANAPENHTGFQPKLPFSEFKNWEKVNPPRINIVEELIKEERCQRCYPGGPKPEICKECKGEGELEVSSDYNDYWVDCLTCEGGETIPRIIGRKYCKICAGLGTKYPRKTIKCGTGIINPVYLRKALYLADVKFYYDKNKVMFGFKNDDFEGIIMGVKG